MRIYLPSPSPLPAIPAARGGERARWNLPIALKHVLILLLLSWHGTSARCDQLAKSDPRPQADRDSINSLYHQSGQAESVSDYTRLLKLCSEMQTGELDSELADYLPELTAWLHNRRGEALARQAAEPVEGRNIEATQQLELRALHDFSAAIQLHATWRPLHNRGVSRALLGQYEEALADFDAAIELYPSYPNTRFNRAELLFELGRFQDAVAEYAEVLRLTPDDVAAISGRAHALFQLEDLDAALANFTEVIRLDQDNATAYADRADVYAYAGQWRHAATDYKMAIGLNSELGRAYQSVAWLMATCPEEEFRDAELALSAAAKAIELDGRSDYRYLDTLAAAQANANQFTAAQQSAQQALQIAPAEVVQELQARLTLYGENQPFREQR